MLNFDFWQRWLWFTSLAFVVFGLWFAFAPFATVFATRNTAIAETFFAGHWGPEQIHYHAFSAGPLGGTMAGFYVLQAFVVAIPFRRRERWAWHAIVWGTSLWFVVDSALSFWHGAAFNVYLVNIFPMVVFGVPLAATFGSFFGANGPVSSDTL